MVIDLDPKFIFHDTEGRFVVVEVLLNQQKFLVVGIYGPKRKITGFTL